MLRNRALYKSWSQPKGWTSRKLHTVFKKKLPKKSNHIPQTTKQDLEEKEIKLRSPQRVLSVLGASEECVSTRTWEGKSAFDFPAAKAMDCCTDGEMAS